MPATKQSATDTEIGARILRALYSLGQLSTGEIARIAEVGEFAANAWLLVLSREGLVDTDQVGGEYGPVEVHTAALTPSGRAAVQKEMSNG